MHRAVSVAFVLLCAAISLPTSAQTLRALHDFSLGNDGPNPTGYLVQGLDGKFYGTSGSVFKIRRYGALTELYNYCRTCVEQPTGSLIEGVYGTLYGVTTSPSGDPGTVFDITPAGTLTRLYHFCSLANCSDGGNPVSITFGWDGSLHGVSTSGRNGTTDFNSTVFRLTPGGKLTTTHTFACVQASCPDGTAPVAIVQGSDGNLYGATSEAGANGWGTVFRIGPTGFSTLYAFCAQLNCADGATPTSLIQGRDGNLYGTTSAGGACAFCGTVFRLTTDGAITTLYQFCTHSGCLDGEQPTALIEAAEGNFYGTASAGGDSVNDGTIFSITPDGTLTTLHRFASREGSHPIALTQATDGSFYGTAKFGGTGYGTVFRLDVSLTPFVRSVVPFGHVGGHVTILGTNLSGVSTVSFNGAPATILAASATRIATTVPTGATSGPIAVTTSVGTLTSNVAFTVLP